MLTRDNEEQRMTHQSPVLLATLEGAVLIKPRYLISITAESCKVKKSKRIFV